MTDDLTSDHAALGRLVQDLHPEVLGVWLFGSFADGHARADSDVDRAVLANGPVARDRAALQKIGRLSQHLAGRRVDLVDLWTAPPVLRFEIFAHGIRIAARDPLFCDRFETTSISMYQRLNIERRELLDEITRRGTVY